MRVGLYIPHLNFTNPNTIGINLVESLRNESISYIPDLDLEIYFLDSYYKSINSNPFDKTTIMNWIFTELSLCIGKLGFNSVSYKFIKQSNRYNDKELYLELFKNDIVLINNNQYFDLLTKKVFPEYQNKTKQVSSAIIEHELYDYKDKELYNYMLGMIMANSYKYPAVVSTVDICLVREVDGNKQLLLGMKRDHPKLHLIGGFVDIPDESLTISAKRETFEETSLDLTLESFKYLTSMNINDWRYFGSKDKVKTNIFMAMVDSNLEAKANDDIISLDWYDLKELNVSELVNYEHQKIVNYLIDTINVKNNHS